MASAPQAGTEDRTVVVTGTSSGIGSVLARQLVAAGYTVVGIARRSVRPEDVGSTYVHLSADLADLSALPGLAREIRRAHGTPFALVNNAAAGDDGLLATCRDHQIVAAVELDLISPILLTKHLVTPMLSRRRGRVVNISSIAASTGFRGLSAYGAAKAGLEGFTRALAREVGPRGVTVNCVAPGFLETGMTRSLPEATLERVRSRSPLRRFATPDEVSAAVLYYLSDAAAGVTGTILTVDAGSTA